MIFFKWCGLIIVLFLLIPFASAQSHPTPQLPPNPESASYDPLQNCVVPQDTSPYEERLAEYEKAISEDPKNPEFHFHLGRLYARLQSWQEAQKSLFQALTYNKGNKQLAAQIYHHLGNIYACQQQFDKAIPQYRQTIRNNPENEDARFNLALTQLLAQQQEKQQQERQQQEGGEGDTSQENPQKDTGQQQQDGQEQDSTQGEQQQADAQEKGEGSQEQQTAAQPEKSEEAETPSDDQQQAQSQTPTNESEDQTEDHSVAVSQNADSDKEPSDEETAPGYLSRQQAEQLINTVPENRRKFLQRLLQSQTPPSEAPGKNW